MNGWTWIASRLGADAAKRGEAPQRLAVRNLTRQTPLAAQLEVAGSGATRRKGLLGRDGLDAGGGLWIVPCESVHTFFMRFPIDLVYLDRANRVRKVCSAVRPWRISACFLAHSVLELPAGVVRSTHTQRGDTVEFAAAEAGFCKGATGIAP